MNNSPDKKGSVQKLGLNALALAAFILIILFVENVLGFKLHIVVELILLTIYLLILNKITGNRLL